jgi:hypothetical protein
MHVPSVHSAVCGRVQGQQLHGFSMHAPSVHSAVCGRVQGQQLHGFSMHAPSVLRRFMTSAVKQVDVQTSNRHVIGAQCKVIRLQTGMLLEHNARLYACK